MPGYLYVVATPLGNLEDFTLRAQRILKEVDLIACEDTRRTKKLLSHFSIQTGCTSYHEHNEETKTPHLLRLLEKGKNIALVSDAGTPLLSDPGYRLVLGCRDRGISVYPVPGPAAVTAALSVSGLPTDRFVFVGFLPRRTAQRRSRLQEIFQFDATLLFYLSPHGLAATLKQILEVLGNRRAFLIREMTKIHESHHFGTLREILETIQGSPSRGEYTLVVEGQPAKGTPTIPLDILAYVAGLIQLHGITQKEAIRRAAHELGIPKRQVYRLFVEEKV